MPLYIIVALLFLGVASILFLIFYAVIPKRTILDERLEGLASRPTGLTATAFDQPLTGVQKLLGRLGANVPIRVREQGKYMRLLVAAGIKKNRLPVFMGSKILLAAGLPALYLFFYGIPIEKDNMQRILISAILLVAGFLLPSYWLSRKVKQRQLEVFHDLPDVLDLMTVCVEAGLSMDAAMMKICEDVQFKGSPLTNEMALCLQETRAGKPRVESLRDMAERTMVDDLRSFTAMLIQTERLGTSLAQSLRVHSDSLRTIRSQRAEEAAAKIPIKLMFPLVFFIFPALLFVILGPGFIRIAKMFGNF